MILSRYQRKILCKKEMPAPFGEEKFNLIYIYSGFRVKPFGWNRTISSGRFDVWGSLSLPSSSQNLKPLATAKVTISGDLDCCRFGKKPPPAPLPFFSLGQQHKLCLAVTWDAYLGEGKKQLHFMWSWQI